jgi:hypothetical protein
MSYGIMRTELLISVEGLYMILPRIRLVEVRNSKTPLWILVLWEDI